MVWKVIEINDQSVPDAFDKKCILCADNLWGHSLLFHFIIHLWDAARERKSNEIKYLPIDKWPALTDVLFFHRRQTEREEKETHKSTPRWK